MENRNLQAQSLADLQHNLFQQYPLIELKLSTGNNVLEIDSIAVIKDNRTSGVGRAVITHLYQWAEENGIVEIVALSAPKAKGFYKKLGFKKHGLMGSLFVLKVG